ncbi:41070_t:CDS:2 [Gigaspora margarita]|uniref:41070_t:CDS:1 n=1 Tax=Gigaspora margarita TaxID=4874 RepID=A0ABN7V263_GIGMA|nr:41070_t:CDS:2 [Gigaspora margarita]
MGRKQKTTNQILTSNIIPTETQKIARVLGSRGKNLHEVQYYEGSYVIIEPLESDKVKKIGGEIVHVLFPEHVKHLKSKGIWPKEFENQEVPDQTRPSGDDSDDQIFVNTNRMRNTDDDDDNSSSDEE